MHSLSRGRRSFSNLHRLLAAGGALVLVLLSCGRDQATGPMRTPGGVARGLSFNAVFPPMANVAAFASVIDFNRVRVLLRHADGTVALDTLVAFPAGADAITLSFDVTLAAGTPAAGELLALNLAYLNAAGDTVFRGGPVELRAAAAVEGAPPPPPVSIPVVYSGPGASAKTVKISPRSLTVNAGAPFAFTAVASDSTGAAVPTAPIVWVTPDPTIATIPVPTSGSGTANASRGTARVIAQLITGASDTVSLNVIPTATAIAVASGNNQSGVIGKPTLQPLAQPIAVRVTAGDGLGVGGVTVNFAAANGGSVSAATVVTDAAGLAQATWSLGPAATTQTATATVASLTGSPVTFTATGAAKPATKLVLTSGPAASADIPSGSPTPLVVAAQDADGDPALRFTGDVTVALSTNPGGGTLAGTTTVAAVGGTASFPAISIAKPGAGYVLQATSGTLTPVSTNAFNIVTGPAANVTLVSGGGQTAEAGASVLPIKVLVTDVSGNPKSGATVTFAAGATFGTVAPASAVTGADGTASVVWTLGAPLGTQTLTATTGSVTPLTVSATAVAVVRQWVITQQPGASLVAGSPATPAIRAELRDAFNAVVTSFAGPTAIAIGANPGSATLGGALSVNAVAGVATFPGLTLNKTGSGYTLVVSSPSTTVGTTNPFTVTPATASSLVIASGNGQSGTVGVALAAPVVAQVNDAFGNPVTGASVTFTVAGGGGSVTPATGSTDAAGRLSTTWTLGSASAAQALTIGSTGLVSVGATATAASPVRVLVFTQQPTNTQAGAAITPALTVEMRDGFGAIVPSFIGAVTLVIGNNPGSATLVGTTTTNAVAGVATFGGLLITKAAAGYTLVASASGASDATSTAFNVTAAGPSALAIVGGDAQTGAAGSALAQPVVAKLTDSFGNPVAAASVSFTVAGGGGSVTPATGTTDAAGQISATWTLGTVSAAQSLTIASTGVASKTVTATATSATRVLVFSQGPGASQTAGVAITPAMTVEMRDGFGAVVPSFAGAVGLAIGANCCGATLAGTATATAVAGVATFSGVSLDKRGGGYTLVASATGATSGTSNTFVVSPAAAKTIILTSGNGQSGASGAVLASPLVTMVTDGFGNGVAGVPVVMRIVAGGGTVSPTSASTDSTGRVSAAWTLGSAAAAQRLEFVVAGVDSVGATATATGGVLRTWAITSQPSATQTAGVTITPAIVAELRDGAGAVVTDFAGTTTLSVATGPAGAVLGGATSVTAANGVATFADTRLTQAGTYTLALKATGTPDASTNSFNVVPASASSISVASGGSQTGTFGAMLAAPVVLKVVDAFGNPVAGTAVTFAVSSGGGSVGTPNATTNASGLASTTWTLGSSGAQTMTGTSTGLTGSPLTISAITSAGSVATTVVSPRNDTLTSFGASRALTATARDIAGAAVAGSFTWTSRDASIATVSSGGVVTAVANGAAYIVATEIGGTRDSALIVVQQRTASVNITPGSRSLYVTGTFAYSAQAVDGRGNAMVTQPTFVWSSTSPGTATVDPSTGVVTAVAIGTTQIRATAGSIVGVSPLSVLTPIKRIIVSIDTGSAPAIKPDTFTMPALGLRRAYRALARDTIDNPMNGVTFTWTSSNASVAAIDSATATKAGAISAANGIATIQASAQGVTGGATLYVAQVLTSIELTPTVDTVSVGGNTPLVARGKDSNNRYITGGNFTYSSSNPAFATVNASTGVVTGVAIGTVNITAASGQIISNPAVVNITEGGRTVISFGRDTIGIGRGTSLSVPILLSRPSGSAVVINLAAADTNAYWSTSTITIAAGATSGNATLNGRNAGTTRVTASDAAAIYTPDTAVVAVQANMRLTTSYYTMNQTDQQSTQVVLSDPSPAGGTYVTFSYGTPGVAQVSPDPAFIPAGQLAADIVIRGVGAGTTSLTPLATGVSGTGATIVVAAPVLTMPYGTLRLGAGQYESYQYVQTPNAVMTPLVVTLHSSVDSIASTVPSVTIPSGYSYRYFDVNGGSPGDALITGSAPGWTSATLSVRTTTPSLRVCCGYTLNTTSAAQNISVYVTDSLGSGHPRLSSLSVRVSSSDTTVLKVLDTLVTINAGTYYNNSGRVIPNGTGGTAWVYVSAGGHKPDSVRFTVVGPALSFGYTTRLIGLGQVETNNYVYIPNGIAKPLIVTLASADTNVAATNPTVTIPAGSSYAYFEMRARGLGTIPVIASATGYTPDTATATVTTPRLTLYGGSSLNSYMTYNTNVYVNDSAGTPHNRLTDLTVSFRSSDPTILTIDTTAVVTAGVYYVPSGVKLNALKPGTVKIYATAPGHASDSTTWTVVPSRVALSWRQYEIGARQHQSANSFYAYIPNPRKDTVSVTLTHSNPRAVSLSKTTLAIAPGTSYSYLDFAGLATGTDTVIATASGYLPDTAYIRVSTPRLLLGSFPSAGTTTNPPASVLLYAADSSGGVHYPSDTVVIHAVSSDNNVVKPTEQYFRIYKDSYYNYTGFQFVGPGTATITYSDSAGSGYTPITSPTVTVTGPALRIAGAASGMLGTGQNSGPYAYYVYIPNPIGTDLKVALASSDPRVATVDTVVTIPAGNSYAYFTIAARDTIGTVQIQANATGYTTTSVNMQVTQPKFYVSTSTSVFTTAPPTSYYIAATDASGNSHYVNDDLVITLLSSNPGTANFDSTTITIKKGSYYSNSARWIAGTVGSARLTASDERAVRYPYQPISTDVTVSTPSISVNLSSTSLGIGQYLSTYTYIPNTTKAALDVTLTHAAVATTSTPSLVTIPSGGNYVYFRVTGTGTGTDTITASAAGHNPGFGTVIAGQGRIDAGAGWKTSMKAGDSTLVTLYTRSPDGYSTRALAAATTFSLSAGPSVTFTLGGAGGAPISSVVVPADAYYVQFYVKAASVGTASVTISSADYVSYTNNVAVSP